MYLYLVRSKVVVFIPDDDSANKSKRWGLYAILCYFRVYLYTKLRQLSSHIGYMWYPIIDDFSPKPSGSSVYSTTGSRFLISNHSQAAGRRRTIFNILTAQAKFVTTHTNGTHALCT